MNLKKNNCPLLYAYENKQFEAFKLLLEKGAKPNMIIIYNGNAQTIFTHAAKTGNLAVVDLMLDYGVDVNENKPNTALSSIISTTNPSNNWREVADFLIGNGADIHIKTLSRRNLYYDCIYSIQFEEKVKYLHSKGLDINNCDKLGRTVLFCCLYNIDLKIFLELGANPKHLDQYGNTCLTNSLQEKIRLKSYNINNSLSKFFNNCDLLFAAGLNINHKNNSGHTALDFAKRVPESPVIEFLISRGAN